MSLHLIIWLSALFPDTQMAVSFTCQQQHASAEALLAGSAY